MHLTGENLFFSFIAVLANNELAKACMAENSRVCTCVVVLNARNHFPRWVKMCNAIRTDTNFQGFDASDTSV